MRACELDGREGEEGGGRGYRVVVAALGRCSRPDRLRSFLYLDFIDREKRQHVLQKLVETIHSSVSDHSESVTGEPEDDAQDEGYRETEAEAAANERGSLPLGGCEVGEEEQRRLDQEFEEAFSSEQFSDPMPQFGGEKRREREGRNQSDPRMVDISSGKMGVKEEVEEGESRSEEVEGEERKRGRRSEEVEEGEVSDSSTEDKTSGEKTAGEIGQSEQVAKFYNELARPDADNRDESPIFYMRNFNNWVKSVLIRTYIQPHITVMDLCCGKGGDLLKWKEGGIGYIVCADISESSVEACQGRYWSPRMSVRGTGKPPFGAEFHMADCCTVRLRERYKNSGRSFNIVSCQFSVHYSFETYPRAHMMLRNACENLRPGGVFIGTTVDSNEIVRRLREADQRREDGSWYIGNDVFSVTLDPDLDPRESLPLFGAKYNFKLHGVVDLPEYLVHFPLLEEMLKDFDMEMILCQNFTDFFSERRHEPPNANLMFKMQAFNRQTATMPPALWEVIGLYLVYVFRKRDRRTH
ncbi:mRNA cap guanine-N7 methyltransferase [Geodia barretti]|uniref:mRNA (guanine-N(7))-methyltransferase n=1 Tax=Geodia barretti TaxID=519541 RepID=A0AA35QWM2_GEOBA|nr:mRNA cap guanine-N7 methyltransferase [Geodia barretti]